MIAQPIKYKLRRVRYRLARLNLGYDALMVGLLLAAGVTTAVWYEAHLYLTGTVRAIIVWVLADLLLLLALTVLVRWLGTWRGWWPWVRPEAIAARVGHRLDASAADRLLNALQLERRLATETNPENADLMNHAVHKVAKALTGLDARALTPRRYHPPLRLAAAMLAVLLLAWVTAPGAMLESAGRLLHPGQDYPAPTPFILVALTGDSQVLAGDTTEIAFTSVGALPAEVELVWEDSRGQVRSASLAVNGDRYNYRFENMGDDIRYHARYVNRAWFSSWDRIVSETHSISIIDRPVIEELAFTITAPAYTGEPVERMGGNVADIVALVGSHVLLEGKTNLPLQAAVMNQNGEDVPLTVAGRTITGGFQLQQDTDIYIAVVDRREVTNAHPIHYSFTARPDYPPTLTMVSPEMVVELDETMVVVVQVDLTDDFGFSRAQLAYSIRHPDYLASDDQVYTLTMPQLQPASKAQRLTYLWELDPLGLIPGDEVRFQVEVFDNNVMTGPGQATSATMIARFPTLQDLFARADQQAQEATEATESVLGDLDEVKALLEEMELSFRGAEAISWEQQLKGKEVLETLEQVVAAMESVQEQIAQLGAQASENNLLSDEVLQKYDELQNLLAEIMTPELEEAMAKLRNALAELDPNQLQQALQNLQFQASEFEAQLDRFLDVFRRALAEMKMDELVTRLEQLAATEERLLDDLTRGEEAAGETAPDDAVTDPTEGQRAAPRFPDLAARHREQERAFNTAREAMLTAAEAVQPYDSRAAEQLSDLRASGLTRQTTTALQRGTQSLRSGQQGESESGLEQGEQLLQALRAEAAAIRDAFQASAVREMMAQFQRILSGVLAASKQQERLRAESQELSRSSPRVREAAEAQHLLVKALARLIEQMMALGQQSFHITPEMGRAVGKANAAMHAAVTSLEGNDPQGATGAQQEGMTALNETAIALANAMAQLQQSGSASGYEQYLQRMQNLTQGQQGLNAEVLGMQLGQISALSRLELARRLQARQRQLAQVLKAILDDFSEQSGGKHGGLGQALEDMDEVIRDFQRRRVTRRTLDKQQRIVTRLLDSQKALSEQDFKEERKGRSPERQLAYTGPAGLPSDLGERDDLIMRSMEKALRAGYSSDYQTLIQAYFQKLAGRSEGGD